jgi:hypothetical protein
MIRAELRNRLRRVSELRAEPVRWLWSGRLALGKLAMLEGDPGLGKSLASLDLCARLSRGRAFPDGFPTLGPSNSLVLNAEDGAAGRSGRGWRCWMPTSNRCSCWRRPALAEVHFACPDS